MAEPAPESKIEHGSAAESGPDAGSVTDEQMREAVIALVSYAAQELGKGLRPSQVEQDLMSKGFNQQAASAIVQRAVQERQQFEARPRPSSDRPMFSSMMEKQESTSNGGEMALGAIICLVGILITVATYSASSGGGTYVVAWGAILFGAIRFIKGAAGS